jgi:hypothetical protein
MVSPAAARALPFAPTTTGVVVVMWRQQFASDSRLAFSHTLR